MTARSFIAVVIAVAMMGGCSFAIAMFQVPDHAPAADTMRCTIGPPVIDSVVAATALSLSIVYARAAREETLFPGIPMMLAAGFGLDSVISAVSAVYGFRAHGRCQRRRDTLTRAEEDRASAVKARAERRKAAWSITKLAANSARGGGCATVAVRDREVRALDAEFHAAVFIRDAAIKACLAPARVAPPAATPDGQDASVVPPDAPQSPPVAPHRTRP